MTRAVARIEQKIIITGADNSADAIRRAQANLGSFSKTARKARTDIKAASDVGRDAFSHGLPGLQGKHDSFNRLSAAVGGAGGALQETTHGVALLDAAMRLLPGPLGAVAAGLTAVGAGAFLVGRHLSEAQAKLEQLGGSGVRDLKEGLDLSADGAVKLSQALDKLDSGSLRPSSELLRQVREDAERMGKDGEQAMSRFVDAIRRGPDAIRDFTREFGNLGSAIQSLPNLALSLGLDPLALGLVKATTDEANRLKATQEALARIQLQRLELAKAETEEEHRRGLLAEQTTSFRRQTALLDVRAAQERTVAIRQQIEREREALQVTQQRAQVDLEAAAQRAATAARADVLEARANLAITRGERARLRSSAATARQLAAVRALNAFDREHGRVLAANLQVQRSALQVRVLQAQAGARALRAERAAEARQRADRAAAARAAIAGLQLRTARAEVDRDGLRTQQERLRLLDLEEAKERAATGTIRNRRQREEARHAITVEFATKRAALQRQLEDETGAAATRNFELLRSQTERSVEIAQRAATARAETARARSASIAESLRQTGQVELAQQTELRQARADFAATVQRIDTELAESRKDVAVGSVDAANLETEAEEKRVQAKLALAQVEKRVDAERAQAQKDRIDAAAASLRDSASALASAGQGIGSVRLEGVGQGLAAAATAGANLANNFKDIPKATDAIATGLGGIGAAAIDAESRRTQQQLEQEKQRELSTASSEQERAAITERFERQKAAVAEEAERRKAAILGAMEVARGVAAAATGNFRGAAAHGVAAGLFGAVAGGAFAGAPSTGRGEGGASGGGFASAETTPAATGGGGGGVVIQQNFMMPLVTQQQIGKSVNDTLKSLGTTGHRRARGV